MISWIKNFFTNWKIAYYEISNWFFVLGTIRKHKKTADWNNYGLRADWIGRIYTVLNPQSPTDDGDSEEILKIKYAERIRPINLYLDKLGLAESIFLSYEKIPKSSSYLFVYSPLFRVITVWKIILIGIFISIFFFSRLDSMTWDSILWLLNKIREGIQLIF